MSFIPKTGWKSRYLWVRLKKVLCPKQLKKARWFVYFRFKLANQNTNWSFLCLLLQWFLLISITAWNRLSKTDKIPFSYAWNSSKVNQISSTPDKSRKLEHSFACPEIGQYQLPTKLIKYRVHKIKVENRTFILVLGLVTPECKYLAPLSNMGLFYAFGCSESKFLGYRARNPSVFSL